MAKTKFAQSKFARDEATFQEIYEQLEINDSFGLIVKKTYKEGNIQYYNLYKNGQLVLEKATEWDIHEKIFKRIALQASLKLLTVARDENDPEE